MPRHPEALSLFTARTLELGIIRDFLNNLTVDWPQNFLIQFCGVGGTGKTLLVQKAIEDFRQKRPKPQLEIVYLNFDSELWNPQSSVADFLWALRESINQRHIRTPLFDTLFAAWWNKMHSAQEMKANHHVLAELNEKFGESAEYFKTASEQMEKHLPALAEVGQASTAAKLIVALAKLKTDIARKRAFLEFHGQLADALSTGTMEQNLALMLYHDIAHYLKRDSRNSVCLIVDGFERLQSSESRFDPQSNLQELCSLLVNTKAVNGRNRIGCLVLSRERLDWNDLYPDEHDPWNNYIDIHVLPGFAEADAREFIKKSEKAYRSGKDADENTADALNQENNIAAMLKLAVDDDHTEEQRVYNPFYLDLCIKQIKQVHALGRPFTEADLGDTATDLKRRFLASLPARSAEALQSLAIALLFNEELFKYLVKEQQITGYGANQFGVVTKPGQTFVISDESSPGWYYFHRLMQEALFSRAIETEGNRKASAQTAKLVLDYVEKRSRFRNLARCQTEHLVHFRWGMDLLVYLAQHRQMKEEEFQHWFHKFNGRFDSSSAMSLRLPYYGFLAEFLTKQLSANHPNTLSAWSEIGNLRAALGHYKEAKEVHGRVLEEREKTLGENHLDTLRSAVNLALVGKNTGKFADAEKLLDRAFNGFSQALPPEHVDVLNCKRHKAAVLKRLGKYDASEAVYREVLAIQEHTLGKKALDRFRTLNDLASVLDHKKNFEKAEPLYRTALARFKTLLGAMHPITLICLSNLGEVQAANKKVKQAERTFQAALSARKKLLGEDHPDTLESLYRLANFHFEHGQLDKAEPGIRRALQAFEKIYGEDHEYTKIAKETLKLLLEEKSKSESTASQ
jgi:hypothetical protein